MFKSYFFAFILLASAATRSKAQWLDVTSAVLQPYNVPVNLIRDHLAGSGIEILQVQFDGVPAAVGYFTGGDNAVGLHRGLIMSTGHAASAGGASGAEGTGSDFASTDNAVDLDDPMLAALTTGGLRDLVRYRITFRASSDSIRFRYVFASEEYPEYACSNFNDVFGFFLEGPGYPGPVNIALVPGANIPVTINNVHPANPIYGCGGENEQYYHDNNGSGIQPGYDGFLDVFIAEAAVTPCGIYTMTLALADVSDGIYDSAVFLEANSFGGAPDISASFEPGEAILPENAVADTVFLTFAALPPAMLPLTVTLGGTAQNGIDYAALDSVITIFTTDTVLQFVVQPVQDTLNELFETVTLTVRDSACFSQAFTLFIADPDSAFRPVDTLTLNGGSVVLEAPAPSALQQMSWTFGNNSPLLIAPVNTMVFSGLDVPAGGNGAPPVDLAAMGSIPFSDLIDPDFIESVCVHIQHNWDDDLNLYVFAPDGQFVELSTSNGANGDNYSNTCFSPSATASITFGLPFAPASAAPFTGVFQPEGLWSDLQNAPLDGIWQLGVLDDANGFQGQILGWSLTFSGARLGDFRYRWNTGDTTRTLPVSVPGVYTVTVSNALAAFTKTFIVLNTCDVFTQIDASVCTGETYGFGGEMLTTAGVYTQILPAANGCDSLVNLALDVLPAAADSLVVALLPGETYQFNGQTLSQAGTYSQLLTAANGCDSTFSLILTFTSSAAVPDAPADLRFSPNPARDETVIRWNDVPDLTRLRVFDIHGREVFSRNINGINAIILKTAGWPSGWYVVELRGQNGPAVRGRLSVRR